ncbi:MarR family transcriptional regulator [Clostridioides mangenotii]|uniref:MarR family winged helix-turn-helix transcriptional regulator n=1 Tax=Metaclostridioides mangenotii TaxID=1540 RepID=UPI00214A893D|nr:MarR family transcriptional regulator [Clostridioides mangenotii]MCR1955080.1 MarR family transcriptional regulator [Clostridioides mangenotii]
MKNKGGLLINKINLLTGRNFNKLLKKYNLDVNYPQGKIIFILSKYEELSILNLCKELSLKKSTLTSMLDRLQSKGYINKRISCDDKRITLVSNTSKASGIVKAYEEIVSQLDLTYYYGFNKKEIKDFENYLIKIYSNIENFEL